MCKAAAHRWPAAGFLRVMTLVIKQRAEMVNIGAAFDASKAAPNNVLTTQCLTKQCTHSSY